MEKKRVRDFRKSEMFWIFIKNLIKPEFLPIVANKISRKIFDSNFTR